MDTLPASQSASQNSGAPAGGAGSVGSMFKEVLPPHGVSEVPAAPEASRENDLPLEVQRAGVHMKAETVELPPPVLQAGVTPVSQAAASAPSAPAIALPLSDDQIAAGLHQSIVSSWRWLAEWCVRQLKNAHIVLTSVQGKSERTRS